MVMARNIDARGDYLMATATLYANRLGDHLDEDAEYWRVRKSLAGPDLAVHILACAIAHIQLRTDEWWPWDECQDMIAILCDFVPVATERENLAGEVERLAGVRPDFTDEKAGDVVPFPGGTPTA
jgi:hypothetical protein